MAQTIKIDQLADTVMKGMEEYAKLAAEDLKKDVQKAGKTVKQQIESTAPKKTGKYSKSWAVKKTRETSDSIQIVVHSKRYQLTHLLEFGHAKRGGGRTRAFPHIAPAEQAGIEQLTRDMISSVTCRKAVRNGDIAFVIRDRCRIYRVWSGDLSRYPEGRGLSWLSL